MAKDKKTETKPQPKYQLRDIVSHRSDPKIRFIVGSIFRDGTYRILPLNADMDRAITAATEDCMSLIKRKGE